MFCWNEDMIRFLRDASEQSDYHRLLAARIARELPENARVCDAGCGLGYLSLRLAPYCRQITAVDRSAEALAVLERNIAAGGPRNITPLCGEIENLPPREPYDAMVFCFFGTAEETLRLARAQCRGRVIIIQKGWSEHRFSLGRKKMNRRSYADTLALLKEPCVVELYSDSKYVVDAIEKGWLYGWQKKGWIKADKKPVLNVDLWQQLLPQLARHHVHLHWVKGHAENEKNNRCDQLAVAESKKYQ